MGQTVEGGEQRILSEESLSKTDVLRASPPMFSWKPLDFFSRVHPAVPVIIFLPVIVAMLIWGLSEASLWSVLALTACGYLIWTLFEYWLHRIVFHFEPERGVGAYLHWVIHGVHHEHPNDPLRLVMPPAVSLPVGATVFAGIWVAFGSQHAPAVGAGFFIGYLIYDMTHYYVHHFLPRGRLGRILRERHMRHHFQDDTRGFGISAPYWDEVFGTSPRSRSTQAGENAH